MTKTLMNVLKKDAQICVSFSTAQVCALQSILVRHITGESRLDDTSWNTLEELCTRIDEFAEQQNQMESKEVEF